MEALTKQFSFELIPVLLVSAFLSTLIITRAIHAVDQRTASSARRVIGLLVVATIIWIVAALVGSITSLLVGSQAIPNTFVFGAFLAWTFELIIINGVFLRSTLGSLMLSGVHPLLLLTIIAYAHPYASIYPVLFGAVVLLLAVAFLFRLGSMKTGKGITSLQLLRAFVKTWVVQEPSELEACFSVYAKKEDVKTEIFLFKPESREKATALILPGIHPGPFSPVGSYNLSELVYRAVNGETINAVVLHGTGGHERNAPTNEITSRYAEEIGRFIDSMNVTNDGLLSGPLRSRVGITNIATLCFGKKIIATISNAPYLSDDLDPAAVAGAMDAASEVGFTLSIVDAHNSVNGEERKQEAITKEEWMRIMNDAASSRTGQLDFGYANSAEIDFARGADISEGGIGVAIFSANGSKNALVTADSNNAISTLRQMLVNALHEMGFEFIELCTSDTHNYAARNRSARGYLALGEGTKPEEVVDAVRKLARLADGRIARCSVTSSSLVGEVPLIGHESLDDFAELTKEAVAFAKRFAQAVIPVSMLLLVVTLFY